MSRFKHECSSENAPKFLDWIKNRGGVANWKSINLSNPGAGWSSPARNQDGSPAQKPSWQAENTPTIYTDPNDIGVFTAVEHKRFPIHLYSTGPFGMTIKLTDDSSAKVREEIEKVDDELEEKGMERGAFYVFDYENQEAVIMVPDGNQISLAEWAAKNGIAL